jgi:nucleoside-diphosphate-sugar epimerase
MFVARNLSRVRLLPPSRSQSPLLGCARKQNHIQATMKILFLGGTGFISTACTQLALARKIEVTLLNRARRPPYSGTRQIVADIADPTATAAAMGKENWDAVVDFIAYTPSEIEQRIALFRGRTGQYVFISSASAYQKPLGNYLITESTPLANPFWDYSRNKIAGEERLLRAFREEGFPMTVVRPSLTYGDHVVPLAVNSWLKSFTAVNRMRQGRPVIVPGDGLTLWTITHNSDFAKGLLGLLGRPDALGHAFHITSDEALTWNQLYQYTAEAAGAPTPKLVHIASDFVTACVPEMMGTLLGDKSHSAVFDNTKIKRFVPDFVCTTHFRQGIARTIASFDADPARQVIDHEAEATWDKLIASYERGLAAARKDFGR